MQVETPALPCLLAYLHTVHLPTCLLPNGILASTRVRADRWACEQVSMFGAARMCVGRKSDGEGTQEARRKRCES